MKSFCMASLLCVGAALASNARGTVAQGFVAGANGVRIHYLEAGPRNARLSLLLIPGWRVGADIWKRQIQYFSSLGDRVVAIDSRSQGGSSVVYSGNSPEDRAADIKDVIGRLGLGHLTLIGWSQGVQDVAAYVNLFGVRAVQSIVLVDAPVSDGPEFAYVHPKTYKAAIEGIGIFSRYPRRYSLGMMHAIISRSLQSRVFVHLADESMKTPPSVAVAMLVQDLLTVDRRPYLKKFDKPTLVIAADDDGHDVLLKDERDMARRLPMGSFVLIHHAAHAVFVDQPREFDRDVETFIHRVAADESHDGHPQPAPAGREVPSLMTHRRHL